MLKGPLFSQVVITEVNPPVFARNAARKNPSASSVSERWAMTPYEINPGVRIVDDTAQRGGILKDAAPLRLMIRFYIHLN